MIKACVICLFIIFFTVCVSACSNILSSSPMYLLTLTSHFLQSRQTRKYLAKSLVNLCFALQKLSQPQQRSQQLLLSLASSIVLQADMKGLVFQLAPLLQYGLHLSV